MRLGNVLGDGESDSKATGRGGAGGVRAVKAVKQPIKRHVYRLDIVVFHCQLNTAPESNPSMRSRVSPLAVSIMIGVLFPSARIRRSAVKPSIYGIMTSRMITS